MAKDFIYLQILSGRVKVMDTAAVYLFFLTIIQNIYYSCYIFDVM